MKPVFEVRHTQSLWSGGEGPLDETSKIELVITKEAIASGFLEQLQQRDAGSALLVLIILVLHTRPLVGEEWELLAQHWLVTKAEQGRLFCWLTRQGIAAALNTQWRTVDRAIQWLIAHELVREIPMPAEFVARFVQTKARGQSNSEVLYILNVNGMLRTQWGRATPPPTVGAERTQSAATVGTERIQSGATVCVHDRQSKDHDHDHDNSPAREILALTAQIQSAWQTALRFELSPEDTHILAEMIVAGETHLPVIQGMLYLLAQRAADNPPETQFALLVGILTGKTSLDWGAARESPPTASSPELPTSANASPPPALIPGGDPVLAQVARWYESEIGPLSPLIADEIRERAAQWRDLEAWKGAFTKAGPIKGKQANHWAYVLACMEGTDGQFKLDRKPKNPPPAGNGGNGGGDRRASSSAPANDRRRGNRSRPRVIQSTPEERAAANAVTVDEAEIAELERRIAASQPGREGGSGQRVAG